VAPPKGEDRAFAKQLIVAPSHGRNVVFPVSPNVSLSSKFFRISGHEVS
jgi:hypothetical protein